MVLSTILDGLISANNNSFLNCFFSIKLFGFETLSRKMPFYFGTHPFSIIGDLKDRLMSPINYRFSKIEMERILESINFSFIELVKTSSGLYIFAKK